MPKVAIVIPVFNESMTIYDTIAEFYQAMPEAEIVVVNNASTDDSAQRAQAALTDVAVCVRDAIREDRARRKEVDDVRAGLAKLQSIRV